MYQKKVYWYPKRKRTLTDDEIDMRESNSFAEYKERVAIRKDNEARQRRKSRNALSGLDLAGLDFDW